MGISITGGVKVPQGKFKVYVAPASAATSGGLWAWGDGADGQHGLGNTTTYSSPVQVGALTDWTTIDSVYNHTLAVNTTGELFAWGLNNFGQIGLGNTVNTSSPIQVGALTTWISVDTDSHTVALKTE
ncbi:hypothetical protein LCGC14_1693410 [marine sediment metagenome]|uniref:Uncharacterized protein n=1 Tax=marine sediment metagenome TaxID=412755 RepID=A0A0F9I7M7_9ZZZZ